MNTIRVSLVAISAAVAAISVGRDLGLGVGFGVLVGGILAALGGSASILKFVRWLAVRRYIDALHVHRDQLALMIARKQLSSSLMDLPEGRACRILMQIADNVRPDTPQVIEQIFRRGSFDKRTRIERSLQEIDSSVQ